MKNSVKIERIAQNMAQGDLASTVNVSRQTIHAIESGKFIPSTILSLKIARALGKTVEELFVLEETD
jgi:putative transcriptional regulator